MRIAVKCLHLANHLQVGGWVGGGWVTYRRINRNAMILSYFEHSMRKQLPGSFNPRRVIKFLKQKNQHVVLLGSSRFV